MGAISVQELTVRFGGAAALDRVSLTASPGAITGVAGPNGAGKSTLLGAIIGEVPYREGRITVDGRLRSHGPGAVAYLPQRAVLDRDYPVEVHEVVDMGRTPLRRPWHRRRPEDRRAVADALDRVGLADRRHASFGSLSGGQQQRVLLARSLAQGAHHLLLDEPFVGVDADTVQLLERVLREQADGGATVVIVDHGLGRLRSLCDQLVLLDRRVVAVGTPDQVLAPEVLARAFVSALVPDEPHLRPRVVAV